MPADEEREELMKEVLELRRLMLQVMPIVQAATGVAEKSVATRHAISQMATGRGVDPSWIPLLEALDGLEVCIRERAGEMNALLAALAARFARQASSGETSDGVLEPEESTPGTVSLDPRDKLSN